MTRIPVSDLLTIIFVLVDDWYQAKGVRLLKGKPGAKPEFSDSEVITLRLLVEELRRSWLVELGVFSHTRSNISDIFH